MPESLITAVRYHDFSCGHRVYEHESKCKHLHGHNYRVHFTIAAPLDRIGRVLDFSVIKDRLCLWLEDNWDHRFLVWDKDPLAMAVFDLDPHGVVLVPFNPTAENMAKYLLEEIAPVKLLGLEVTCVSVTVEETRKCAASAHLL